MKKIAIPAIFITGAALAYKLFNFELLNGFKKALTWLLEIIMNWFS